MSVGKIVATSIIVLIFFCGLVFAIREFRAKNRKRAVTSIIIELLAIVVGVVFFIFDPPAAPVLSLATMNVEGQLTIEMQSPDSTWIYYLIDSNGLPNRQSNKYKGPIKISKTSIISAIAIDAFDFKSNIIRNTYEIAAAVSTPIPPPIKILVPGDLLRAVNCNSFVTLRKVPDASEGKKIGEIPPYEIATYISSAENGFYQIDFNGNEGYALAAYLAPEDSEVFRNSLSLPGSDLFFNADDLLINGITVGVSKKKDVEALIGSPNNITDSVIVETYVYSGFSITFSKSTLKVTRFDINGPNISGPFNIYVGMHMAEALNKVKFYKSSILKDSHTQDLILYSGKQNELSSSYAVIRNDGLAGNGLVVFYENNNKGHMDIVIKDSYVTAISVYKE